jgi:hypothetical protein
MYTQDRQITPTEEQSSIKDASTEKRYVATMTMYVYADNAEEAKKEAENFALGIDKKLDNQCTIEEIGEMPFGSVGGYTKID